MYLIGIDCGATNLRVGVVEDRGHILSMEMTNSPLRHEPDNFGQKIKEITTRLLGNTKLLETNIEAIGVGTPGPIDLKNGLILKSSNLGNQQPINLKHQFDALFNSKVYFDRDTHMALRGEAWVGGAADSKDVVMLTLGSGVGGAVMIDGKIEQGSTGMAGEIGHIYLETENKKDLPTCGLGHQGCLEGFIKHAKDLDEISFYLGIALANLVDIFNPQKIIIGGGMIKQGDFLPAAVKLMKEKAIHPEVDQVIVQYAQLGDLSGVIGAAKLALDSLGSSD